ncbi:cytochrome P450 [Nocardia sp. ET3-3]|uniref:Cytochrome P450 n=1 Tax=Nocardia terrae TaxID=2675851 RepID=A0A7K1US59_9NOCA|nr:cytochrome P450 [Nocardia terrae]MVU77186.1 cytochrome P450 [Nocardia terrae]
MKPQFWLRWLLMQGTPRLALKSLARRGDPLAQLLCTPQGMHDPYPLIESVRAQGPMVRGPLGWSTADYELCRMILRDNTFRVRAAEGFVPRPLRSLAGAAVLPPNPVDPPSMLVMNPPEHTRLRRPVASAFTPRAVKRLHDRVVSVTAELLDRLSRSDSADLAASFAAQVPIAIISEMLGFPDEDRDTFLGWGEQFSPMLDIGLSWRATSQAISAIMEWDHYLDTHLARLRSCPGDDILSGLVEAGQLDDHELKATASLLLGAGFETTVNLIGNGIVALLEHPDQLARLHAEPDLWPNAVEEILRFDAPVQRSARIASADLDIGGVQVREGSTVVLLLAGANRDPAVFGNPEVFDVGRVNARDHLTFSTGIHACLGASLARMEATYALRALFEQFPDLQLAGPPHRTPMFTLHGFDHMPARLGTRQLQPATT